MKSIRIGTRNSPLAMWQAREVEAKLKQRGWQTEIYPILSSGDKNLNQPLYALGITGIFTRDLDLALLNGEIDIAVHSLKDVPTQLPQNISLLACLERDFHQDVLVRNEHAKDKPLGELKVATSSLRRRAFWLQEFPGTCFEDIRGNVQTRLKKIHDGLADATVFSLAGLRRLNLNLPYEELPFMISAPSQGVVCVTGRGDEPEIKELLSHISHRETYLCVKTERDFLKTLEGGCTAPIGAFAKIIGGQMRFTARLCSLDGADCINTDEIISAAEIENAGVRLAEAVLKNGGDRIMAAIKEENP